MNTNAIVYDQLMEEITAIPPEKTVSPSMPMDTYLQTARQLFHWAQTDKAALLKAGLSEDLLDDLPYRADAAEEAQTIWQNFLLGQSEALHRWNMESPEAYELREELIHAMRYAFRKDIPLRTKVTEIASHDVEIDLISDLDLLSTLGRENPSLLRAVGFKLAKLEQAAIMSQSMRSLKNSATGSDSLVKRVRDQAYTHLKEAVDTIRECGQYVFWKDHSRRSGYESNYDQGVRKNREDTTQPYASQTATGK